MNKSEIKKLIESVDIREMDELPTTEIVFAIYGGYATSPSIRAKNLMGLSAEQYRKIFCDRVTVGSVYQDKYPIGLDVNAHMLKDALMELVEMKEETDTQEFTLDDLQTGMFVVQKNMLVHMVMDDTLLCVGSLGLLDSKDVSKIQHLQHFVKNTMTAKNPNCDIMTVYQPLDPNAKHFDFFIRYMKNRFDLETRYKKVFDRNVNNERKYIDSEIEKLQNQIQDLKERKTKL